MARRWAAARSITCTSATMSSPVASYAAGSNASLLWSAGEGDDGDGFLSEDMAYGAIAPQAAAVPVPGRDDA